MPDKGSPPTWMILRVNSITVNTIWNDDLRNGIALRLYHIVMKHECNWLKQCCKPKPYHKQRKNWISRLFTFLVGHLKIVLVFPQVISIKRDEFSVFCFFKFRYKRGDDIILSSPLSLMVYNFCFTKNIFLTIRLFSKPGRLCGIIIYFHRHSWYNKLIMQIFRH